MPPDPLPPHDIAAEESLLAALMVDARAFAAVQPLAAADFFREVNGWVYDACVAALRRWGGRQFPAFPDASPINEVTVAHELGRAGRLDDAGGLPYLSRLIYELITPVGVEYYAAIVRDCARRRRRIAEAGRMAREAYSGAGDGTRPGKGGWE